MNIFVSNLGFNSRDEDLKRIFEAFGEVASAKVIIDKFTDRSKGFGFVEMPDENAAKKAISDLDGTMVDGRPIKINVARPKESSNNNSSFRSNKRW